VTGPAPGTGKVFISYRRRETSGHAGRLYDRLAEHFGSDRVFMDLRMEPGVDFVKQIDEAVASCEALLSLIGAQWLDMRDSHGRRRLDDPEDFARLEAEAALARDDVRVIPVLLQDAKMPDADELPASLAPLARRHAIELSDERWDYDVGRLIEVLDRTLGPGVADPPVERETDQTTLSRTARIRQAAAAHPVRVFAAGSALTLLLGVVVLWLAGVFSGPEFKASFTSPHNGQAVPRFLTAGHCRLAVSGNEGATSVTFSISGPGPGAGALNTERDPPWDCSTPPRDARWDSCFGHGNQPLASGRHTLSARVIDGHDRIRDARVAITLDNAACPKQAPG
jgi:TIR domain-containing protein